MPYIPQSWDDEVPTTTPIKYKISEVTDGDITPSAEIEIVTPVTPGSPVNASRLNYMEAGIETAQDTAEDAAAAIAAIIAARQGSSPTAWNGGGTNNYSVSSPKIQVGSIQININIASGSRFAGQVVLTFPQAFTNPPIILLTGNTVDYPNLIALSAYAVNNNNVTISGLSFASITNVNVMWIALGN